MLPDFPIVEIRRDFTTDQARLARACHLRVSAIFRDKAGRVIEKNMRLDTGAPFNIIPYSFWNQYQLSWLSLGTELYVSGGQLDREALTWLGVPCSLGELQVRLQDEANQRSHPLRLVAKLPIRPVASHLETTALIGYNFLADNSLTLMVSPTRRTNAGILTNIVGHLTVP